MFGFLLTAKKFGKFSCDKVTMFGFLLTAKKFWKLFLWKPYAKEIILGCNDYVHGFLVERDNVKKNLQQQHLNDGKKGAGVGNKLQRIGTHKNWQDHFAQAHRWS